MTLILKSPAFADGEQIPDEFARDGPNLSPPLEWTGAPEGTKSFLLLVEDPDAPHGTFRHWAVYDIPAGRHDLEQGAGRRGADLKQGANDFGNSSWDGPQPPEGHGTHHYHFRLAALDTDRLAVGPRQRAEDLWSAARENVIEETELVGTYER